MDPVNGAGPMTQPFGANPQFAWQLGYGHLGCDWGVKIGTNIYSISNDVGTVLFADWGHKMPAALANECMMIPGSPNSGICVITQYDGWRGGVFHLDSTHLNPGAKVRRGDVLGKSGNTGNSTGPHVHFETWTGRPAAGSPPYGRYNPVLQIQHEDRVAAAAKPAPAPAPPPASKPIAANVRRVGPSAAAAFRDAPNTTTSKVVASAAAGSYEAFLGYVVALPELNIGGVRSNMWYVDQGEDGKGKRRYSWAGLYTEQRTAGLPNLTPPEPVQALAPNQRKAGPAGLLWRPEPKRGDTVLHSASGGGIQNFTHYAEGEEVISGGVRSKLWYRDSIGWVWAGGFTEQVTRGLTRWEVTAPAPEGYTFKASLPCVTKVLPAHTSNFVRGNIPAPPDGIVFHQFNGNTPEEDPVTNRYTVHLGSLENTFPKLTDRIASAHWAGEGVNVTQFVHHLDRAQHAGPDGNGFWSVELYGGMDAETIRTAGRILREANELRAAMGGKGRLKVYKHDDIMQTKCGRHVDLDAIQRAAYPEDYAVTPAPAPVPVPETPVLDSESIIRNYVSWRAAKDLQDLKEYLKEGK